MSFAYLKAVLSDVQQQVAEALDGMEQSSRWDRLKRVQAMMESAVEAVGATEKGVAADLGKLEVRILALESAAKAAEPMPEPMQGPVNGSAEEAAASVTE